ncbi:hypothetical protein SK128_016153 [Halocaridina rubra]|uniref:Uncharacterized protein n=1 Tax=Halocaridina rubra TaxID=373956 RepID=A0AAN8WJA8_HALRR
MSSSSSHQGSGPGADDNGSFRLLGSLNVSERLSEGPVTTPEHPHLQEEVKATSDGSEGVLNEVEIVPEAVTTSAGVARQQQPGSWHRPQLSITLICKAFHGDNKQCSSLRHPG